MYLPKHFKIDDVKKSLKIIRKYPFATLISQTSDHLHVTHLPLIVEQENPLVLVGHMARANPHAKVIDKGPCTIVFHGPHTYITPTWYKENDVPTWNYAAIHIKAGVEVLKTFSEVLEALKKLTQFVEDPKNPKSWQFFLPEDLSQEKQVMGSIIAFKLNVQELQSKFKLSQNRSKEDIERVKAGLKERTDDMSQEVLELMKDL